VASGGWLGNVLTSPLSAVSSLFSGSSTGVESSAYPSVTAYDLVPSTESTKPDSAVMGDSYNNTKKKRGLSSLYVDSNSNSSTGSSDYTGRSGL